MSISKEGVPESSLSFAFPSVPCSRISIFVVNDDTVKRDELLLVSRGESHAARAHRCLSLHCGNAHLDEIIVRTRRLSQPLFGHHASVWMWSCSNEPYHSSMIPAMPMFVCKTISFLLTGGCMNPIDLLASCLLSQH